MSKFRNQNGGAKAAAPEKEPEKESKEACYQRSYYTGSGWVHLNLYENLKKGPNGEFLRYGLTLKKTYKTDDGYADAKGFAEEDLPHLIVALSNAAAWIDSQARE